MGNLLGVVTHDPQLDAVLCLMELPADETPQSRFLMNILAGIGQALDRSPIPAFSLQMSSNDVRRAGRNFLESNGIPFLSGGLRILIPAIGKLMDWTEQYRAAQALEHETPPETVSTLSVETAGVESWSEHRARAFLQQYGIPVIPATLATSDDEAVEAAQARRAQDCFARYCP
jgi:acyl-CoA synthetase (NDP forming)